jgi:hypothetical protein
MDAGAIESVESLLDELDLDETVEAAAEEEVVEELSLDAELDDESLRALDADIAREEVYAEQESDLNVDPAPTQAEPEKKRARSKNASSTAKTSVPRAARDLNSVEAGMFVLEGDAASLSDTDKDAAKTATIALKPGQKKIAEKFENLFLSLAAGRKPSTFIVDAFALLEKQGSIAASDIIAAYKADGYSQGTAASQAGQIMHLFDTVKIATRAKNTLTINPNSTVASRLRASLA